MDQLVAVFGGGGFVGRYVVRELAKIGARVRIVDRQPKQAWFLKTQGALGQTQFVAADITRPETLAAAVRGASAVVNLAGTLGGDFQAIHVDGARALARAAADAGAEGFVHVSAIGADPRASSLYARSKGEGEAAVREAFPAATILRPSVVFGREDHFLNRFARLARMLPMQPVLSAETRFQPVYVADVAKAIATAAMQPHRFAGCTFELGGPEVLTMAEISAYAAREAGHPRRLLHVPDGVGVLLALLGFLPGAPLTWDQWKLLHKDNVVSKGAEGFAALGIAPTPMEAVAPGWMVQFRRHGRFSRKTAA